MLPDQAPLLALSIGISVALLDRLKHHFLVFAICALPGTLLHELSHFLVAALTGGQPSSFSIIPRRVGDEYVLGQVGLSNAHAYNVLLIALAPLSLLPLAYWLYRWLESHYASQPVWLVGLCVFAIASISYGSLPSRSDLLLVWRHGRASVALLAIGGLGLLWLWVSTSPN